MTLDFFHWSCRSNAVKIGCVYSTQAKKGDYTTGGETQNSEGEYGTGSTPEKECPLQIQQTCMRLLYRIMLVKSNCLYTGSKELEHIRVSISLAFRLSRFLEPGSLRRSMRFIFAYRLLQMNFCIKWNKYRESKEQNYHHRHSGLFRADWFHDDGGGELFLGCGQRPR